MINRIFKIMSEKINFDSFYIIGSKSQTLQITLNKYEKININKKFLVASSSEELTETIYNKIDLLLMENSKNLKRVDKEFVVNLKNNNSNTEYICLSNGGKIMKIEPSFYNNLYIKLDYLLAFNNGIELYIDNKKNEQLNNFFIFSNIIRRDNINRNYFLNLSQAESQFYLVKPKLKIDLESQNLHAFSSFLFNKNKITNDLLFLSGKGSLFEKRLGEGESMIISPQSLVAFEGSVSFEMIEVKDNEINKYVNSLNHVIIKGPGLIIFEPCQRIVPLNTKKKLVVLLLSIIALIVHVIIYFLVFLN